MSLSTNDVTHMARVSVVDSHTGGEPTRVVFSGGPDLGSGPLHQRVERFRRSFDGFRSAVANEPRGSDVWVGALLCEPHDPNCDVGVIFFNNVGFLGMCGHGTIGLLATLAHLGRIEPGPVRIDTPVGAIAATLHPDGSASLRNVPAFRLGQAQVEVPDFGTIAGEVAWGGNWFFILDAPQSLLRDGTLSLLDTEILTRFCRQVKRALADGGVTGAQRASIDHIELCAASPIAKLNGRNFVLCPGDAFDRSPCGTGTSAKLACLLHNGKLRPGEAWQQESITGSVFEARAEIVDGHIVPIITGRAFVNAEATLLLDPNDPLCWGLR